MSLTAHVHTLYLMWPRTHPDPHSTIIPSSRAPVLQGLKMAFEQARLSLVSGPTCSCLVCLKLSTQSSQAGFFSAFVSQSKCHLLREAMPLLAELLLSTYIHSLVYPLYNNSYSTCHYEKSTLCIFLNM